MGVSLFPIARILCFLLMVTEMQTSQIVGPIAVVILGEWSSVH